MKPSPLQLKLKELEQSFRDKELLNNPLKPIMTLPKRRSYKRAYRKKRKTQRRNIRT